MSTHAVGGVTLPDVVMAAKLDALPVDVSPKWLKEFEKQKEAAAT